MGQIQARARLFPAWNVLFHRKLRGFVVIAKSLRTESICALRFAAREVNRHQARERAKGELERKMAEIFTRDQVKAGLANGTIVLLDVREPNEFASGHIPGAVNFPLSSFNPAVLPKEAGKRIVFSCRSGQRTQQAMEMARLGGRSDANAHYAGSMNDWLAAGELVEL